MGESQENNRFSIYTHKIRLKETEKAHIEEKIRILFEEKVVFYLLAKSNKEHLAKIADIDNQINSLKGQIRELDIDIALLRRQEEKNWYLLRNFKPPWIN